MVSMVQIRSHSCSSYADDSTCPSPEAVATAGALPQPASTTLVQAWHAAGEPGLPIGPFHFALSRLQAMQRLLQLRHAAKLEQPEGHAPPAHPGSAHHLKHEADQEATSPAPAAAAAAPRRSSKRATGAAMNRSDLSRKSLLQRGKLVTSSFRGVNLHARSNRWDAHIWDGRQVHLGCFMCEQQAAIAYDLMAIKAKGQKGLGNLNYPAEAYSAEIEVLQQMTKDSLLKKLRQSNLLMRGAMQQLAPDSPTLHQIRAFFASTHHALMAPQAAPLESKAPSLRRRPCHSMSSSIPEPTLTASYPRPALASPSPLTDVPPDHPSPSILPPRLRPATSTHAPTLTPHPKPLKRVRTPDTYPPFAPSPDPLDLDPLPPSHPVLASAPSRHPPAPRSPFHTLPDADILDLPSIDWPPHTAPLGPLHSAPILAFPPSSCPSDPLDDHPPPQFLSCPVTRNASPPTPSPSHLSAPPPGTSRRVTLRPESPITSTSVYSEPDFSEVDAQAEFVSPFYNYPPPAASPQPMSVNTSSSPPPLRLHPHPPPPPAAHPRFRSRYASPATTVTTTTTSTATTYHPSSRRHPLAPHPPTPSDSFPMSTDDYPPPAPHHHHPTHHHPPAYPSHDDPALSSCTHPRPPHHVTPHPDELSATAPYGAPSNWPPHHPRHHPSHLHTPPPYHPHTSEPLPDSYPHPPPDAHHPHHHAHILDAPPPDAASGSASTFHYPLPDPSTSFDARRAPPGGSPRGSAPPSRPYLSKSILPPKLLRRHLHTSLNPAHPYADPPMHAPLHAPPPAADAHHPFTFPSAPHPPYPIHAPASSDPFPLFPHSSSAPSGRPPTGPPAPSLSWPLTHIPSAGLPPPPHGLPNPPSVDELPSLTEIFFPHGHTPTPPISSRTLHTAPAAVHSGQLAPCPSPGHPPPTQAFCSLWSSGAEAGSGFDATGGLEAGDNMWLA